MRLTLAHDVILALGTPSEAATVHGTAKFIDGDSLLVADQEIRLHGTDPPEGAQPCERSGSAWPCGREARARGVGIFAGEFVEPSKWRRGERYSVEAANDNVPGDCPIKGNI